MLKLYSETITHKTDVGGVQLNLVDAAAVATVPIARSSSRYASRSAPSISWA